MTIFDFGTEGGVRTVDDEHNLRGGLVHRWRMRREGYRWREVSVVAEDGQLVAEHRWAKPLPKRRPA